MDVNNQIITTITWTLSVTKEIENDILHVDGYLVDPYFRDVTLDDVQTKIDTFMMNYFDSTLSDEQIASMYGFEMRLDGLLHRSETINLYSYQLGAVSISSANPNEYEVELSLSNDTTTSTHILRFQIIMFDDGNDYIQFIYPPHNISDMPLENYVNQFIFDLQDLGQTAETLCDTYFASNLYQYCLELRTLVHNNNYWISMNSMFQADQVAEFSIALHNDANELIETFDFEVVYEYDLIGTAYPILYPFQEPNEYVIQANNMLDYLVESLTNGSLSVQDFCIMYADCPDHLTNQTISEVTLQTIMFDPDMMTISAELHFTYQDGTVEYHIYDILYTEVDNQLSYHLSFSWLRKELPSDAVLLDIDETTQLLEQLFIDVLNPNFTDEMLCQTYFYLFVGDPDCVQDTNETRDYALSVTMDPLTTTEENGETFYVLVYYIEFDDNIEQVTAQLRAWRIPGTDYYHLEFID
jgi:hypothetical protein